MRVLSYVSMLYVFSKWKTSSAIDYEPCVCVFFSSFVLLGIFRLIVLLMGPCFAYIIIVDHAVSNIKPTRFTYNPKLNKTTNARMHKEYSW